MSVTNYPVIFVIVCDMWIFTGDEMRVASVRACLSFSLVYGRVGADLCTRKRTGISIHKVSIFLSHDVSHIVLLYCSTLSCLLPC